MTSARRRARAHRRVRPRPARLAAELSDRARSSVARSFAAPPSTGRPGAARVRPRWSIRPRAPGHPFASRTASPPGPSATSRGARHARRRRRRPRLPGDRRSGQVRRRCGSRRRRMRRAAATRDGVLRLVLLAVPSPLSYVQEHLTASEKLALAASPYASAEALIEDCRAAVARHADRRTVAPTGVVRTAEPSSRACATRSRPALVDELFACVSLVARILTLRPRRGARHQVGQNSPRPCSGPRRHPGAARGPAAPGFRARQTGIARLAHFPRYLEGMLDG